MYAFGMFWMEKILLNERLFLYERPGFSALCETLVYSTEECSQEVELGEKRRVTLDFDLSSFRKSKNRTFWVSFPQLIFLLGTDPD